MKYELIDGADTIEAARPVARTIEATCRHYSWTRTFVYQQLAAGKLTAIKAGRRTNILTASADRLHASLPQAVFRAPREGFGPGRRAAS